MYQKAKWILGRLKKLLPCFLLIGISLTGYWYTAQKTPMSMPPIHLKSEKGEMEGTLMKEQIPTAQPATRRWVIVVGQGASCNSLALKYDDWMVLMVDGGHTAQRRHSRCVFMNHVDIDRISSELHLSDEKQSRLFAAYLYAIQRGARAILSVTASGDASTLHTRKHTATVGTQTSLISTSKGIMFDAAAHFGCNRTSRQRHAPSALSYSLCRHKVVAVETTAACSGVQAPVAYTSRPVCDSHAAPVALTNATFAPIYLDGALFTNEAFWALPAAQVANEAERFTWSLVVQRLLWLSGNKVVVRRCRTDLSETASNRLATSANQLNSWQCLTTTMKQCIVDLIANSPELLKDPIMLLYSRWLDALEKVGYIFPQLNNSVSEECEEVTLHAVDHSVPVTHRRFGSGTYTPVPNIASVTKLYNDTCRRHNLTLPEGANVNFAQPWTQFDNVLLVVIFNNPHYDAIPYIEALHRPFFPNILYCGPSNIDVTRHPGLSNFTFSFISYGGTPEGHVPGAFNYKCMAMALQMDYAVHGYLAAADDMLLFVHTLSELTTKAVWFRPKQSIRIGEIRTLRECKLGMCDFYPHWVWWKKYQNATLDALGEIANRRRTSVIMHAGYQRLLSTNGAADRPNGCFSDIYYIPNKLSQEFLELVDVFLRHRVFLEIAVPTIIRCLVAPTDVEDLRGIALWDVACRTQPWKCFKTQLFVRRSYWHPLKWGILYRGSTEYAVLYCSKILPYVHDRYARSID